MDIDRYLRQELESIKSEDITQDEKKMLELGQIEYFIGQRLLSKKFRKNFLKDTTKETIKKKIAMSVKGKKPIYLIFAFGGYKNPWVKEAYPHIEWSEFFHLIYLLKLLSPIAKYYEPGVFLEYESECEATIYHNNFSKQDIDEYTSSFKKLVEFVKPYTPSNITINYITLPEQYDTKKFFEDMDKLVPAKMEDLRKTLGDGLKDSLKRPLFNLKLDGPVDLTKKTEEELNEIALRSLAFNHVYLEEDYKIREEYFNGEERISMVGTYCSEEENPDNWISINSVARSANAFWTSRGVLVKIDNGYQTDIIGPKEFEDKKNKIKWEEIKILANVINGLNKIPIVE
ncbi:MAG: hypothetical protein UT34_C0002G0308 [candidate division WS6 bacterium GW2011_GWF2_39_15]|uniref:Uncharacterized protein n=1 Tax=candidate division WS6 bacterium GW2011_GWF2_39_15 TaxID=1619100 RepID=A0A0G0MZ07_9BACT|nr:MAG: hypothetical protein UT34_C0002G0308 [candidate division WS6 bacterium GW2011_GWF2_39_15]